MSRDVTINDHSSSVFILLLTLRLRAPSTAVVNRWRQSTAAVGNVTLVSMNAKVSKVIALFMVISINKIVKN
jgi:hypothetical protein